MTLKEESMKTIRIMLFWMMFYLSGFGNLFAMSGADDFTKLSLEELMEVELTSAARKSQKLSQTAEAFSDCSGGICDFRRRHPAFRCYNYSRSFTDGSRN